MIPPHFCRAEDLACPTMTACEIAHLKEKGGTPKEEDKRDKYILKMVSGGRCVVDEMDYWRDRVLTAKVKKAGSASEATLMTSRPPSLTVTVAWIHCVSVKSELVMRFNVDRTRVSKTTRSSWSADGEQRSRCWTHGALKDARRSKRASWEPTRLSLKLWPGQHSDQTTMCLMSCL